MERWYKIMDKVLSIRPNGQIIVLFMKIQAHQESANRTEIVNAGIETALATKVDWEEISKYKVKDEASSYADTPEFMQIRVDEDDYLEIRKQIFDAFHLKKVPPAPYVIKLILINYLSYLETLKNKNTVSVNYDETTVSANGDIYEEKGTHFRELLENFKSLGSVDEKLDVIYEKLLELERGRG